MKVTVLKQELNLEYEVIKAEDYKKLKEEEAKAKALAEASKEQEEAN